MKSISIIGCGWLGTQLAAHFILRGCVVYGTTTSAEKIEELTKLGIQASLFRLGSDDEIPSSEVYIINIPPSRIDNYAAKVQELFNRIPASARQILFCSSTSVYPDTETTVFETDIAPGETLPADARDVARHGTPRSVLLEAEGYAAMHDASVIIRLAGLIGGGRNPARFLSGRKGIGQPLAPVNLTHLDDLIKVISALVDKNTTGEVFNICASEHPTRKAYYTDAALKAGLPPPEFDDTDTRSGKTVDSIKIEQHTGLKITRIEA